MERDYPDETMMTQREFERAGGGHTQCAAILERLRQEAGQWVAMPELSRVSGSLNVAVRVQDIRLRTGLKIENQVLRNKQTGLNDSWYRLLPSAEETLAAMRREADGHRAELRAAGERLEAAFAEVGS